MDSKFIYNGDYHFTTDIGKELNIPIIKANVDNKEINIEPVGEVDFNKKGIYELRYNINDISMSLVYIVGDININGEDLLDLVYNIRNTIISNIRGE